MILKSQVEGWVRLGDGGVKFPLYTWTLCKAATQPQARALYIALMLLFSCLADGHSAAARITYPQIHQILWLGTKSGVLWEHTAISLVFEILFL